jgi:hypothetical protein
MRRMKLSVAIAVYAVVLALSASAASAQATRTWVSGVGDDVNPCSRTAPCKTFAGAISKTAAGGEISVLDPGSFGTITITKAITIDGQGQLASILNAGTTGITVNAGTNDKVTIRNISIQGAGTGTNGIRFLAGKQLVVDHVTISGFTTRGIDMAVSASSNLMVSNSTIFHTNQTNVATNSTIGIRVNSSVAFGFATLNNVELKGLSIGVEGALNAAINISNSVITRNLSTGVLASSGATQINVDSCQVGFNDLAGVNASVVGATIRLVNSSIHNNGNGILIAGGATVASDGKNRVFGNGASTAPNAAVPLQ